MLLCKPAGFNKYFDFYIFNDCGSIPSVCVSALNPSRHFAEYLVFIQFDR